MTLDDLKKIKPIPGFDCVKMKHDIQAKIYEETKDMTWEERRAYFKRGSEEFHREMAAEKRAAQELMLREEPPEDEQPK